MGTLVQNFFSGIKRRLRIFDMQDLVTLTVYKIMLEFFHIIAEIAGPGVGCDNFIHVGTEDEFVPVDQPMLRLLQHVPMPTPIHHGMSDGDTNKTGTSSRPICSFMVQNIDVFCIKKL